MRSPEKENIHSLGSTFNDGRGKDLFNRRRQNRLDLDIDTERRFCRNAEPGPRFPRVALLSLGTRESFFLGLHCSLQNDQHFGCLHKLSIDMQHGLRWAGRCLEPSPYNSSKETGVVRLQWAGTGDLRQQRQQRGQKCSTGRPPKTFEGKYKAHDWRL